MPIQGLLLFSLISDQVATLLSSAESSGIPQVGSWLPTEWGLSVDPQEVFNVSGY